MAGIYLFKASSASLTVLIHIDTGTVHIKTSDCVKCLGVSIDCTLSFNQHVNNVCKSAYYHVKALRHTRKLLTDDAAKTVACAMVAGRLDYCNAVLIGSSTFNIDTTTCPK